MRQALDEPAIPVPDDHGAVEFSEPLDRCSRLRSRGDVAEADEPVDPRRFEVLEDGFEGEQVAM
jgi:hypothetical protein